MTVLRRLQGVSYWVIEDPSEIKDFINTNIRREWEADARSEGRNLSKDPWLRVLSKRRWRLEVVETDRIAVDPDTMNYEDQKKGYSFQASLAKRRKELRSVIENYDIVIWPLIIRNEDMVLTDGYCRLSTLQEMGTSQVYAYLGTL